MCLFLVLTSSFSLSITTGHFSAAIASGTTRTGSNRRCPPLSNLIALSPPRPKVSIYTPFTKVLHFPILTPSSALTGIPFLTIDISVVVPPISIIRQSFWFVSSIPPITLEAGPLNIVSTARRPVNSSDITLPSLLTITMGALIFLLSNVSFIAFRKFLITGISLALSNVLEPLWIEFSSVDNSCPQITRISYFSSIRVLAFFSNSALFFIASSSTMATASASWSHSLLFIIKVSQSGSRVSLEEFLYSSSVIF